MVAINDNDFIYPYLNWDYFYYIVPALAGSLVLCMMASYCFRMCQRPRYRDGDFFGGSSRSWRRNNARNNNNTGGNSNAGRRQDPFVTNQNSQWRSSQRNQRRYERLRGQNNGHVSGVGHQFYPAATNPYAQVSISQPIVLLSTS